MTENQNKNHIINSNQKDYKKNKFFSGRIWSVILGIIGLIIVLSIIAGGALLASHIWNPKWNPFKQNPDKGIREKIFKEQK